VCDTLSNVHLRPTVRPSVRHNMNNLNEQEVSSRLSVYFANRGLIPIGKHRPFAHADDSHERSFEIDLAIGPICTLGNRSEADEQNDRRSFEEASVIIDPIIEELRQYSLFPRSHSAINSWRWEANPIPVYGLAVEIENDLSKYLLGSMLAAAIAGRWGILILPDYPEVPRWIATIHRMMHKGAQSPIPSNVAIFSWRTLQEKLIRGEQGGPGYPSQGAGSPDP
jgi:hypothetical protein